MNRCGQVSPVWVRLGFVKWQGHPEREPLMNIEYRRCLHMGAANTTRQGLVACLCREHAEEHSS